jgi:tRNA wybutosine-synthesizing protein 1
MKEISGGLTEKIKGDLKKKSYGLFGVGSAVQICNYTKSSLRGNGGCWKQKFYGIDSSRCCQFSPCVMNCDNNCLHCWRPIEMNLGMELSSFDEPEKILEGIVKERKKLLTGFGGREGIDKQKLKKSFEPSLYTLSLSGEATLYPKLPELISLIRNRGAISFLVTNGQNPSMLKKLEKENALPTQLILSVNAPNRELFIEWHSPRRIDAWERFNQTVSILELKGKCRRCIRLTLVAEGKNPQARLNHLTNMSEKNIREYACLIKTAEPNFVHVKGYTSIGSARNRLGYDKQPLFHDIELFSKSLLNELNKDPVSSLSWKILGKEKRSNVIVLGKTKSEMKIKTV